MWLCVVCYLCYGGFGCGRLKFIWLGAFGLGGAWFCDFDLLGTVYALEFVVCLLVILWVVLFFVGGDDCEFWCFLLRICFAVVLWA